MDCIIVIKMRRKFCLSEPKETWFCTSPYAYGLTYWTVRKTPLSGDNNKRKNAWSCCKFLDFSSNASVKQATHTKRLPDAFYTPVLYFSYMYKSAALFSPALVCKSSRFFFTAPLEPRPAQAASFSGGLLLVVVDKSKLLLLAALFRAF